MIIGNRVYLRELRRDDMKMTLSWRNDIKLKSMTMSHPFPVTSEIEDKWYDTALNSDQTKRSYYAICKKDTSEIIGYIFLGDFDWISRHCCWGGLIGDGSNQGKGLGREAVNLIINFAFEFLNMNKVYAWVRSDHPALKTWLRTGAVIEGELMEYYWNGTSYHSVSIISWNQKSRTDFDNDDSADQGDSLLS